MLGWLSNELTLTPMKSGSNHKIFSMSATFFTSNTNEGFVNKSTMLSSHRSVINHEGYEKLNIVLFWAYCTSKKKTFSLNGAFKTTGLLHVRIHPIVRLLILIVKHCVCLHVVHVLLVTTPYHEMDPPAPKHLGGKSRCCHSTASSVNAQVLQWSWHCFPWFSHKAQYLDLQWVVIYSFAHDNGPASSGVHTSGPYLFNLATRIFWETMLKPC